MKPRYSILPLLPALFASGAFAQIILPTSASPGCAVGPKATYPDSPLPYPLPSDRYAVQYQLDGGAWTDATVYISYYGGTNASPAVNYSTGYTGLQTSMSFVSIPARVGAAVQLRVTKLWGPSFQPGDRVSVRPRVKPIFVDLAHDGSVQLFTQTAPGFAGDQFLLWWGDDPNGAAMEGLVFFLDPPYAPPAGGNVMTVSGFAPANLDPAPGIDTLAFAKGLSRIGTGAQALIVPPGIRNIYFAPGAWVQGKLHFQQSGGNLRRVYGPGVLDVSRFEYDLRVCGGGSGYADQGYDAITWDAGTDRFLLDGIVITDHNHATTDLLVNSAVNNVKSMGWSGVNRGLKIGSNTNVSNVFARSGDDSLMVWGSSINITNATVWQNYNGGGVNLGWFNNSPGDNCLIDGLYVVKTDWLTPTNTSWTITTLNDQNNAVIASLMVPGTKFGSMHPSVFRNIFVEDSPRVLFSLKILPPDCDLVGLNGNCPDQGVYLTLPNVLNLNIEHLFTPAPQLESSIGFQSLPPGYTYTPPSGVKTTFANGYTLKGSMRIGLTNVEVVGKVTTNGDHVDVDYFPGFPQ